MSCSKSGLEVGEAVGVCPNTPPSSGRSSALHRGSVDSMGRTATKRSTERAQYPRRLADSHLASWIPYAFQIANAICVRRTCGVSSRKNTSLARGAQEQHVLGHKIRDDGVAHSAVLSFRSRLNGCRMLRGARTRRRSTQEHREHIRAASAGYSSTPFDAVGALPW
ncbi:hypothetical protein DFH06DRAFT_1215597 [Mycena polygramma]|nr:hypothetical protein DFH06DRAFT_1215597 [Mycena polygramma]